MMASASNDNGDDALVYGLGFAIPAVIVALVAIAVLVIRERRRIASSRAGAKAEVEVEAPATEAIDWASPRPGSSGERKLVSSQGESLSVEGAEYESIAHPSPEKKEGDVTIWSANDEAANFIRRQLRYVLKNPLEGVQVKLIDDTNVFEWAVTFAGPPESDYEGGFFKVNILFPVDYPYAPPELKFMSEMWHPNVYADGRVCLGILEDGGDLLSSSNPPSPDSGGFAMVADESTLLDSSNRGSPSRSGGTTPRVLHSWHARMSMQGILASVISLLSSPSCDSPANVDAAAELRNAPSSFRDRVRALVRRSQHEVSEMRFR